MLLRWNLSTRANKCHNSFCRSCSLSHFSQNKFVFPLQDSFLFARLLISSPKANPFFIDCLHAELFMKILWKLCTSYCCYFIIVVAIINNNNFIGFVRQVKKEKSHSGYPVFISPLRKSDKFVGALSYYNMPSWYDPVVTANKQTKKENLVKPTHKRR